ncbi:MAG: amidohydrolase family protein [Lentisphaeria bacterium]|nr:amidohydrolase family protein [Lentisphaeria bacterium]
MPPTGYVDLTGNGKIRLVIQTEYSFEEIESMAKAEPEVNFIIASGERKLLYHYAAIEKLLLAYPNIFLANGNFCSTRGLERLIDAGCRKKLLYGSMAPFLDPGQAQGPVVLGQFDWETKCDIAGNNFRRILGIPAVSVPEEKITPVKPFIVDAHTHTNEEGTPSRFPAPGAAAKWELWEKVLDDYGVEYFFNTPGEAIYDAVATPARLIAGKMCENSQGRVRYFCSYDPRHVDECLAEAEKSLADPYCIGLKIHPAEHNVFADDERYAPAFEIAGRFNKAIMSHTWGVSDYNPNQKFATPMLFDRHCQKYPATRLVLGHAGGRPNGFPEAAAMCKKYENVFVDLAGDFFHNGVIRSAAAKIGADRIIFASDIFWIDPRCMLGMLLASGLSAEDLMKILRTNALKVYLPA